MTQKPIDWNRPLQTKNGFSARVLANDLKSDFPIVVALSRPGGMEAVYFYNDKGESSIGSLGHELDLINVPEKKYIGIYLEPDGEVYATPFFDTEGKVKTICSRAGGKLLKIVEVELPEPKKVEL